MWCVLDLGGARKLLVFGRKGVKHFVAAHERRGAEGNLELVTGAVVVTANLLPATGDLDGEECGYDRRGKTVQSGINVPSVEAGEVEILLWRDGSGVEGLVVRVAELYVLEAFVLGDEAVANDLDLRLVCYRDGSAMLSNCLRSSETYEWS